jgi:hypothetical protein
MLRSLTLAALWSLGLCTAKDAPLSISGHYQVALDRRTGFLEGLYIDPFAAPQQRLVLSPAIDESGAIGFGAYDYR